MLPENIKKACELAAEPGRCRYTNGNEPICVIGQLAVLEGCTVAELTEFQENCNGNNTASDLVKFEPFKSKLEKYDSGMLRSIQQYWDCHAKRFASPNKELLYFTKELWETYATRECEKGV